MGPWLERFTAAVQAAGRGAAGQIATARETSRTVTDRAGERLTRMRESARPRWRRLRRQAQRKLLWIRRRAAQASASAVTQYDGEDDKAQRRKSRRMFRAGLIIAT